MKVGNSLTKSNFLFLCLLFHTATHQAFESAGKINKIKSYESLISQNWQNTLDIAVEAIP